MTHAPVFRSTRAFAARIRTTGPAVERATFVTFSLGHLRFAAPVEVVERVLRWSMVRPSDDGVTSIGALHVPYAAVEVPVVDLAAHLALSYAPSDMSRALIIAAPAGWIAVVVDAVHEVATVDAASIEPVAHEIFAHQVPRGVRGTFVRQQQVTFVLDVVRAIGLARS